MLIFCFKWIICEIFSFDNFNFRCTYHTFLVYISIIFTFMFLKIRILFRNILVLFTLVFHDIQIQIIFTRWIYGWSQGCAQSIYLDTLKISFFPMKLLAHINFFLALFLPIGRWNKTPINYKVLLNWLANQKSKTPSTIEETINRKLLRNFPETEVKF